MMEVLEIEAPLSLDYASRESTVPFLVAPPHSPTAEYRGLILRSVFQPIGSVAHGRAVGFEALLRAVMAKGQVVAPATVFDEAKDVGELTLLNQIVSDLHIASFCRQDPGNCWLFLNISSPAFSAMISGSGNLSELAAKYGLPPSRIVVEVLEDDIVDSECFDRSLGKYKDAGFMVAMDDFGKGWSNFDRIFNFLPSIVKFDMSLIPQGRSNVKVQRAYRHLTSMLHEIGIMVLAEGIENVADASFMVEAGVDFLQGYWLSRPNPSPTAAQTAERSCELRTVFREQASRADRDEGDVRAIVEAALSRAAEHYAADGDIDGAANIFYAVPRARVFIVLDENGFDIGVVLAPRAPHDSQRQAQLAPVWPTRDSTFVHHKYFRDAVRLPNQIHFASPVFSLVEGTSIDVAAKAVTRDGALFVVCGIFLRS